MTAAISNGTIRIVIVDDNPFYRETVRNIIEKQPNLKVVGEAGDGVYALQTIEKHRPDIVLMDITLPYLDGIEATRKIRARFCDTKIIMLTMHSNPTFSDEALIAGACHFLTKDCNKNELLQAIKDCSAGPVKFVGHPSHSDLV